MNSRFGIDAAKFSLYIDENKGWQKAIEMQVNEIPLMEKMLKDTVAVDEMANDEKLIAGEHHFTNELVHQQQMMEQVNTEISRQQERLTAKDKTDINNCIDMLCTQDILRQRIREIERMYIELKYNFMNYLSNLA